MNELTLSTGRRVLWEVNSPADRQRPPLRVIYAVLGDVAAPTAEEKLEAATEINKGLHPQKEVPDGA